MIAIDTNVLVRYAVKDDREQTVLATEFLAANRCFLLKSVLLELVWVLSSTSGYNLPRGVVLERLYHILGLPSIETEDAASVSQALNWYGEGMDFADALHLAGSTGLTGLVTFDRKFAETAGKLDTIPTVSLLDVPKDL
jgi:predicted nucleic-acid-binding protein